MTSSKQAAETGTMVLVFVTVLFGWVGFSLPYPVFSHLFLDTEGPLLAAAAPEATRTLMLGIAVALYPAGQLFGAPLFGRWSDLYGRKPMLQAALATTVAGAVTLAAGVSLGSLALVFLGRFVAGIGEGNIAIVQSLAADVSRPQTKARNFALIGIAMDLGFVAGPILGGALADPGLHHSFGLATPFWAAAGLFLLNAALVPLFLREPRAPIGAPPDIAAGSPSPVRTLSVARLLGCGAIGRVLLLTFLTYWSIMIFFDFFPVYFVQSYGTAPAQLGINAALLSVPLILAGLVVGRLSTRIGAAALAVLSLLLMIGGTLGFIAMTSEAGHILPAAVVAFGINFGQTATSLLASDAAPAGAQGQVMGLYRAMTVAAGGLAALVGGYCAAFGPPAPFVTAVAAALLGLVLLAARSRRPRHDSLRNPG